MGRLNGQTGAQAAWTFTDNGKPGKNDEIVSLVITDKDGMVVLEIASPLHLEGGNHQWVPHKSSKK